MGEVLEARGRKNPSSLVAVCAHVYSTAAEQDHPSTAAPYVAGSTVDSRTVPAGEERWRGRCGGARQPGGRLPQFPGRGGGAEAPGLAVRVLLQDEPAASTDRVPAADRHGNLPGAAGRVLRLGSGE